MSSKRRKKPLPPRRKRMSRQQRLQAARNWIRTFKGSNIVKGYRRWYGVDSLCAVRELGMLGIQISPEYRAQLERTERNKQLETARRREQAAEEAEEKRRDDGLVEWFTGYELEHLRSIGFFEDLERERELQSVRADEDVPF